MKDRPQKVVLVRHGETEWSLSGRHTSHTDLDLTPEGERRAEALKKILSDWRFDLVLCSPRLRAIRSCDLLGWGRAAVKTQDLTEWNYGDYEGLTTAEIRAKAPGWTIFTQPCPGGESASDVARRVDRVIAEVQKSGVDTLLVSHGHCLRVLTARWLGLDASDGRFFQLETGTWSILSYERETPVLQVWSAPPK
ncbi:MAG: histidine phosphatase family protein [bacterium]